MAKRILIAFGVLLFAGLCMLAWRGFGPREPVYKGRPISQWLRGHVMSSAANPPYGSPGWEEADRALRAVGTNAIPTLLSMIAAKDPPPLALKILAWAQNRPWISYQYHGAFERNQEALYAFKTLGTNAASAVPALAKIYVKKVTWSSKNCAAGALGSIGSAAQPVLPVLLHDFTSTNKQERFDAVSAVMSIGGDPDLVLPALMSAAKDPDVDVRWNALVGLSIYGHRARVAVPMLLDELGDAAMNARSPIKGQVETTLWRIAPEKVGRPLVIAEDAAMTNGGLTAGTVDFQFNGLRRTVLPGDKSIPCVRQFWDSMPRGILTVYRVDNAKQPAETSLGGFEIMGVPPPPTNVNISVLCVIADGKIFLCARDNLSETFLEIRKVR
jgi:hypothetical protein